MGTPLTGSSVASTYTGLLKNTDNSTVSATLKAISDGSGNDSALQISSVAVNTTGDFSVNGAASKFTVASASGNTLIAGTLGVTGATNLSSLATSGAATIGGALNVTGATTLTGNLTVPGNLAVTGTSTLTGNTAVTGTLGVTGASTLASVGVTGAATVGTTLGVTGATTLASVGVTGAATVGTTLGVTGASTLASLGVTGAATVGTTLGVTGNTTLTGDLAANGNTTLGNAGTDTLTLNSDNITAPNISTVTVDIANDKVLIADASDSSKVKVVTASSLGISASNAPQVKQTALTSQTTITPTGGSFGTEITGLTTTITPRSITSTVLVTITICYGAAPGYSASSCFRLTRDDGTQIEIGYPPSNPGNRQSGISSPSYYEGASGEYQNSVTMTFLDSPATTSAVTYRINIHAAFPAGSVPVLINRSFADVNTHLYGRSISTIILQEYFA